MFTWLNKQTVRSSEGFIVRSVSRFIIEYWEGDRCISIDVESDYALGMKPVEKISSRAFKQWNDGTLIEKEKQTKILRNFIEAMQFQGIEVVVE